MVCPRCGWAAGGSDAHRATPCAAAQRHAGLRGNAARGRSGPRSGGPLPDPCVFGCGAAPSPPAAGGKGHLLGNQSRGESPCGADVESADAAFEGTGFAPDAPPAAALLTLGLIGMLELASGSGGPPTTRPRSDDRLLGIGRTVPSAFPSSSFRPTTPRSIFARFTPLLAWSSVWSLSHANWLSTSARRFPRRFASAAASA